MRIPGFGRRRREPDALDAREVQQALRDASAALAERYSNVDAREVESLVFRSAHDLWHGVRGEGHLPIALAASDFAAQRLGAAHPDARNPRTKVLFLSTRNDGISQMAEAFLGELAAEEYIAYSAGLTPADKILRSVRDAMAEVGLPLERAYPKPLAEEVATGADVIVTMLCDVPFAPSPAQRVENWEFDDPAGVGSAEVRNLRDRLRARVERFVADPREDEAPVPSRP